jgi:hypothetical protein
LSPGLKSRRRRQKGPEDTYPVFANLFPQTKAGQRDTRAEAREARIGKRGITVFFDGADAFFAREWNHRDMGIYLDSENPRRRHPFPKNPAFLGN